MTGRIRRWLEPWLAGTETVPIARCVHFGGFHYGRGTFNPYENYVVALVRGAAVAEARERFVDFLRHYRPRHLGAALGVELTREYPLWGFPWERVADLDDPGRRGWTEDPGAVPDILTHFSERGILYRRIEEEFSWLERALRSIREHGYQPARFTGHLSSRKLTAADGSAMHLITDGNHRLSTLAALGHTRVVVSHRRRAVVDERQLRRWPQVAAGGFSPEDARRVLRAYFDGNARPRTTEAAAPVLADEPVSSPP